MSCDVPAWWRPTFDTMPLEEFIHEQHDVVSRKQWLLAGGSLAELRRRLRRRDWTTVFPGVYFVHRAQPPQSAQDLAALLYAGDDAAWCHETAAARWGWFRPRDDIYRTSWCRGRGGSGASPASPSIHPPGSVDSRPVSHPRE